MKPEMIISSWVIPALAVRFQCLGANFEMTTLR